MEKQGVEQGAESLLLTNFLSPGDLVMLTAAIRDLHRSYPGRYQTDVRTPCPQLWENNPFITPLDENDPVVRKIHCHYPLIHRSNTGPWHFIHGFIQHLGEQLGIHIQPTDFKGDIHLSPDELNWMSQVQEITRDPVPYWIIVAGGKRDFTIKWWAHDRFQEVVDYFRDKILFVQVGEEGHVHAALNGVLDLRGKTDLRQLVRLVHHSQGVLCPVTLLMHLAAAVRTRPGSPQNRPCVVVAGGREPSHWVAYTHHQFLHTNGSLWCCDNGGCWKARTTPLNDGDEKDRREHLCVNVLPRDSEKPPQDTARNALAYGLDVWPTLLPRCMSLLTATDVIRHVELYFQGGTIQYLTNRETELCRTAMPTLGWY